MVQGEPAHAPSGRRVVGGLEWRGRAVFVDHTDLVVGERAAAVRQRRGEGKVDHRAARRRGREESDSARRRGGNGGDRDGGGRIAVAVGGDGAHAQGIRRAGVQAGEQVDGGGAGGVGPSAAIERVLVAQDRLVEQVCGLVPRQQGRGERGLDLFDHRGQGRRVGGDGQYLRQRPRCCPTARR